MWTWEQDMVLEAGYDTSRASISREAVVGSTTWGAIKETQSVHVYENYTIDRPTIGSILRGGSGEGKDGLENILKAMAGLEEWSEMVFGKTDSEGKTITYTVLRNTDDGFDVNSAFEQYKQRTETYSNANNSEVAAKLEEYNDKLSDGEKLGDEEQKVYSDFNNRFVTVSDGALNDWIGYAPVFKSGEDFKIADGREANIESQGRGQMGQIFADYQWNSFVQSDGYSHLNMAFYDQPLWDDRGSWMSAPTVRGVVDIACDILAQCTGQEYIAYLDDAIFAITDLSFGYQDAESIGKSLAVKALGAAIGAGSSAVGGAIEKIGNGALKVAAQTGLAVATSAANQVGAAAINNISFKDIGTDKWFNKENFMNQTFASKNFYTGLLTTGASTLVTSGLNEMILGERKVYAGEDKNGKAIYNTVYNNATGFSSQNIASIKAFTSLSGGLTSNAMQYAFNKETTFNVLNFSDLVNIYTGITGNQVSDRVRNASVGMFELTVGEKGVTTRIGQNGTNVSATNLMKAASGLDASVTNARIKKTSKDVNLANALRAQYGFGDKTARTQLKSILKGDTVIETGGTSGKAETVMGEDGKRHVKLSSTDNWMDTAITLGHEAYRDGVVGGVEDQFMETMSAVFGHTTMALRMQNDELYSDKISNLILNDENLTKDIDALKSYIKSDNIYDYAMYIDSNYDYSSDFWKLVKQENGKYGLKYDGKHSLYDENNTLLIYNQMDDVDENGNRIHTGSFSASLGMLLGTYTDYTDNYDLWIAEKSSNTNGKVSENIINSEYTWNSSEGYTVKSDCDGIIDANAFLMTNIGIKTGNGVHNLNIGNLNFCSVEIKNEYGINKGSVYNFDYKSMTNITMIENMIPEGMRLKAGTIEFRNGQVKMYGLGSTLPDPNKLGTEDPKDPGHKYSILNEGTYFYANSVHNIADNGKNAYGAMRLFTQKPASWEEVTGDMSQSILQSFPKVVKPKSDAWSKYRDNFLSYYYDENGNKVAERTSNINGHKSNYSYLTQSNTEGKYIGGSLGCLIWYPTTYNQVRDGWSFIRNPVYGKITINRSFFGDGTGGRNNYAYDKDGNYLWNLN